MDHHLEANAVSGAKIAEVLTDLALDLRWSFNHSADKLWERLDPELWALTHNPSAILRTVSRAKLETLSLDSEFQEVLAAVRHEKRMSEQAITWFECSHHGSLLKNIAYFSMEFMLSEALPIYSGGLGNVAGDQLKTASNLGVPITGIGLLYQQGYFRQELNDQGEQQALYPFNDPGQLPIRPLRRADREWLRLSMDFPGGRLWIRTWQVQVGRAKLYLLDTNDPANMPAHRGITSELYGGGPETRLKQEIVLGIGGWRLLKALGQEPEVCHLNEGHAAFAALERARSYMAENHKPFELALTITRVGNLFTTHTPVSAGFDRFEPELVRRYLRRYAEEQLAISFEDLLALGRLDPHNPSEAFNMAYLAVRTSGATNGVSRLHGEVSRKILQPLFPQWPQAEVPILHVTNGISAASWDSALADRLWEQACGKERWRGTMEGVERDFRRVPDDALWQLRCDARKFLVEYVRKRNAQQLEQQGAAPEAVAQARLVLDANILTLGFARRFAAYKRPNLLLQDPQRLAHILTNPERPVQLVLAGKAHPQDVEGQSMIRQWVQFALSPQMQSRVVFLSDYDVLMAEHLVQGVDVWLNTPRRPWEASGTSGMKVLVNGGLNLSELDGWWAEAYSPGVGWAIGDGQNHGEDATWDRTEAESLYALLECEVVPAFYERDPQGIPSSWVCKMRESMARLTPAFSTNRVVREYTEKYYLPAAAAFQERAANEGSLGSQILRIKQELAKHWPDLRFGSARLERLTDQYRFDVQVFFGALDPETVRVELFAEGQDGGPTFRCTIQRGEPLPGPGNGFTYSTQLPATRPSSDYTARATPFFGGLSVPLEIPLILWQHSPQWR
jgi:starch phosphorylase